MNTLTTANPTITPGPASTAELTARDWRPSIRAKGIVLAAGGAVYALSHALNLLGSTPTLDAPHEIAAKALFAAGAILIMAGLGSLVVQFARSPLGILGAQLTWFGMLYMPLNAYMVLYVFPLYGWEGIHRIDELAVVPGLLALPTVMLGPVLLAIASWRHGVMAWWNAALMLAASAGFVTMIAVPEWEPPLAIGSTIVMGIAFLFAGLRARRATAR